MKAGNTDFLKPNPLLPMVLGIKLNPIFKDNGFCIETPEGSVIDTDALNNVDESKLNEMIESAKKLDMDQKELISKVKALSDNYTTVDPLVAEVVETIETCKTCCDD